MDKMRELALDPETFGSTLLAMGLTRLGWEALEWTPETWRLELRDQLGWVIPESNFTKLLAALAVVTTDWFQTSLPHFVQICNALSGTSPQLPDPADVREIAWAIVEASLLAPPESEEVFDDQILYYISAMASQEGLSKLPRILSFGPLPRIHAASHGHVGAEDPEMFQGMYQVQGEKAREVDQFVQDEIARLFDQLELIRWPGGSAGEISRRLRRVS